MRNGKQSLALALICSMLAAQNVQAATIIQPFDKSQVQNETDIPVESQTGTQALIEKNGQSEPGVNAVDQAFPEQNAKETPIQTEIEKPVVSAEAGILYDATHDRVLFEKNADKKLYPASITKLMTALVVLENGNLSDTVTFSEKAVTELESGAVTLGLTKGDQVSVKDCLYGLLLKSANEVANGLAEYAGGSISGFVDKMNAKAKALGCTGTRFANPSGLNSTEHYSTCRDMARIAKAAFENETICQISSALSYQFPETKKAKARTITPGHKMLYPADSRYDPGMIGGKTGYTSLAGNTLVTCTERNGVRLIAVVLKARSTHYTDTKAMLEYGYALTDAGLLQTGNQQSQTAGGTKEAQEIGPGVMASGWRKQKDEWYYYEENGEMAVNAWRQDAGKWFYLGADGTIVRDAMVDGKYYVGADGVWIP